VGSKMPKLDALIKEIEVLLYKEKGLDRAEAKVDEATEKIITSQLQDSPQAAQVYTLATEVKIEIGKYVEAEPYAFKAFEILKDSAENRLKGRVQWCIGRIYKNLGDMDKARIYLEDSRSTYRTIGYRQGELEALNGLIHLDFIGSEWSSAKKRLKYAYQINQESGDRRGMALCLTNLATVSILLGEHSAAEKTLLESIKIKEKLGDPLLLTHSWLSLARLYLRERRWSEASRLIQKAKKVSEEHTLSRELAMSLESEGELYFERKEYVKAEKSYLDGLRVGERISPEGDVVAELCRKLADLYSATKEPDKAIEYGHRALEVSTKLGDRFEQGCCHRALAVAYGLKGLKDKAQEKFAKSVSIFKSIGERFELAYSLLTNGELSGRVGLLREAYALFSQIEGAVFYKALAELQLAKVDPSLKAEIQYLREAEDIFRAKGEAEKLKEVEVIKAELNRRLTQPTTKKYEVLKGLASPELGEVFEGVVRELKATRGFVAYRRDASNGEMKVERSHNLTEEEARKLLSLLTDNNGFQPGEPFILYDTELDNRFSSLGAGSVMITPFSSKTEGRIDGFLYVDRQKQKQKDGEPFLDKEYDLFYYLSERVGKAISEKRQGELEEELSELKRSMKGSGVLTHNPQMLKILKLIELAQGCDAPTLLTGETGTGKDFIARIIHQGSARKDAGFVEIHCGAIPKDLVESELFGYEKGAFTGAVSRKLGRLELAEGGTLFLNELGELSESTQVKLLRFLDTTELERVGGNRTIRVNTRVIAATNKDLKVEVENGTFRKDLYYRLNVLCVELPPLRERKEDIPPLAHHFIKLYGDKYGKKVQGMAPGVLQAMMEYDWPGNIRELENMIGTMVIATREGEEISVGLLPKQVKKMLQPEEGDAPTLPSKLASVEKEAIWDALERTNGIKTKAAQILGIHEATLRGKIKKYKLEKVMDN